MIDIKSLREKPDFFKEKWQSRGLDVDVDAILANDVEWRKGVETVEQLKNKRKTESKQIGLLKKNGEDATEAMEAVRKIGDEITELDKRIGELRAAIDNELLSLPNPPSATTPVGASEEENVEVRSYGTKEQFDFQPLPHWDVAEKLGIIDNPRGAKISGSGFPVYRGMGAKLERALINWFLDEHDEQGYEEVFVPFIVTRKTMTGTGQLPKFEDDLYKTEDDMFLIPTAEVPITNLLAGEILEAEKLPVMLNGYTPCFRREAGAAGKDTRGILRVHQFNKVEMVKFADPETSYTELELLTADAEHLLQKLGLHYRVLELCSADLGFSAAKCYDLEVWAPGVDRYLEVSSCSNFEDFQARRANIKFRPEAGAKPQFVHTLNGSGLALPRCMAAILETYQREDGGVDIPDALVPYLNGVTEILPAD